MVSSCLPLIPFFLKEIVNKQITKKTVSCFPDHIIINILSRLPAEHVIQCRQVCKRWRALSSTKDFIDLHLKRATPTLIAQFTESHLSNGLMDEEITEIDLCFIEDWRVATKRSKEPKFNNFPFASSMISKGHCLLPNILQFSLDGLLVFSSVSLICASIKSVIVANPITQQKLTVNIPEGSICGIFSNPHTKDYWVLWFHEESPESFKYEIRSLKPQSSWKGVADFPYSPRVHTPPVRLNESLHWGVDKVKENGIFISKRDPGCEDFIMVFNIVSEDFSVKPHPGGKCVLQNQIRHCHKELVEIQGHLAFSEVDIVEQVMQLWILEDYNNWDWKKRYKIFLDMDVEGRGLYFYQEQVIPLGILDGELLVHWKNRGLLGYHPKQFPPRDYCDLEQGIARRYYLKVKMDDHHQTYMLICTKSLVSDLFSLTHI